MEFLFALHFPEQFDNAPYCEYYAVSILSIGDIESHGAALYFAHQERKVHLLGGYK